MRIAYFDCFSGVAGDMVLGALLDLGLKEKVLKHQLKKLPVTGYDITVKSIEVNHIAATDVTVKVTEQQPHRSLSDILSLLTHSTLDASVKRTSTDIFVNLAKAEARVHRIPLKQVHFHEVGAVDSIIDIVGSVIGITLLGIKKIYCSPLPLGHGFVSCAHGILPLPAPATVELLKGVPVYSVDRTHELVTPTGAALMTTLASRFTRIPPMKITAVGYGSGKLRNEHPNLLRVYLGTSSQFKMIKNKKKEKKK